MTTIWQTVAGQGDPVDGNPAEFRMIEQQFRTIKSRMFELDDAFDSIRNGTSGDFKGQAADAFRQKLNQIATAVGEVPLIAAQLESTFRHHRVELERLQQRVNAAVARAQSNWNEKCAADGDHTNARHRLSSVESQLEWLESQGDTADEGDKYYWTRELNEAQGWVSSSRNRVHRADDRLEDSRHDWRQLHDAENALDDQTAAALRSTVLWSLADPSLLEQIGAAVSDPFQLIGDFLREIGELAAYVFPVELILDVVEALEKSFEILALATGIVSILVTIVGALLIFTGVGAGFGVALLAAGRALHAISVGLSVAKLAATGALAAAGRRTWTEFGREALVTLAVSIASGAASKAIAGSAHSTIASRLATHKATMSFTEYGAAWTKAHIGAIPLTKIPDIAGSVWDFSKIADDAGGSDRRCLRRTDVLDTRLVPTGW